MINRRNFVRTVGAGMAGAALAKPVAAAPGPSVRGRKMVGIQIGAISFLDEGVEEVLDILEERAHVNALFLAGYGFSRGVLGRQVPGNPLPDHGRMEYDLDLRGGNYATVHPEYYKDTAVDPRDLRAPDHGDWDFFAEVLPAARKRGMKVIPFVFDGVRGDIPNISKVQAVDLHGRKRNRLCHHNPYFKNLFPGIVEDYLRSYDLDGIMYGCEGNGPLNNALGGKHYGSNQDPGRVGCFCQYCQAEAKKLGINFDGVKRAFLELEKFVQAGRSRRRPVDGYHVTFWRLLLNHPELLIWEHFFYDSMRESYQVLYEKVKSIDPNRMFGVHIAHENSFSPIYRAEQDLSEIAKYTDFVKVVMYHNAAGPRLASYIDSVGETIYGDIPMGELLQFHYRVLNYDEEPYGKIPHTGLKHDYVYRESKRAVQGAHGAKTLIVPGIDIDIPTRGSKDSRSTPEDVEAAVTQAFQAGVDGIILSRKYSEMRLANLSGAGAAIEKLGLA